MALAGLLCTTPFVPVGAAERRPSPSSCDWPMYGHDAGRTMATRCTAAPTKASVSRLHLSWRFPTTDVVTATPTVVGGVVYAGDWAGHFYAVDLASGKLAWSTVLGPNRTDGQADHHTGAYGTITSSAAVTTVGGRRMAFVGAGDSIYAIDASASSVPDGQRVVWRTDLDPAHPTSHGEVESSPVVWLGAPGGPEVFVGSDANQDSGYVGEGVWAVRAATGQVLWHFNPETSDPAGYPAGSHPALYGCGNVWSSPALGLDPSNRDRSRRGVLYFGTADCPDNSGTPCPPDHSDPGCTTGAYNYAKRWNRDSQSILAVSAVTGSRLWSYQAYPEPVVNDDDYGASAQLFTTASGRRVVGEANKDGTYAALDRSSGAPVWRAVETGNGNVQSGLSLGGFLGATAVAQVAGRPQVFGASAIDTPITYDASGNPTLQPTGTLLENVKPMVSFSGDGGQSRWWAPMPYTYGATSTGNGIVYVGSLDGLVRAFDASDGRLLWAFPVGAPISSGAAVVAHGLVIGDGTDESDVEFKTCDRLPGPTLSMLCKKTPLNQTINPLSYLGAIYAFSD